MGGSGRTLDGTAIDTVGPVGSHVVCETETGWDEEGGMELERNSGITPKEFCFGDLLIPALTMSPKYRLSTEAKQEWERKRPMVQSHVMLFM